MSMAERQSNLYELGFVGRDRELALVHEAHADIVANGSKRFLWISGAAGMGKSALMEEASRLCQDHGLDVRRTTCQESGSAPYRALTQLSEVEIPSHVAEDRYLLAAKFSEILNATPRPIALFVDDIQWADFGTALFLSHCLVTEVQGLLVYVSGRPIEDGGSCREVEELWRTAGQRGADRVELGRLTQGLTDELAGKVLGRPLLPNESDTLFSETGGYPLAVVHVCKGFKDSECSLNSWQGQPELAGRQREIDVILESRILTLEEVERELLECVAVFQNGISAKWAAKMSERSELAVIRMLDGLVKRGFLVETNDQSYSVSHSLLRRSVLRLMKPTRKRAYHAEAANILSSDPGADPEELVQHHEGCGNHREAFYGLWRLGQWSPENQYSGSYEFLRRAQNHLNALTCVGTQENVSFCLDLANAMIMSTSRKEAMRFFRKLRIPEDDDVLMAKKLAFEARYHILGLDYETGALYLRKSLDRQSDPFEISRSLTTLAACREGLGQVEEAIIALEDSVAALEGKSGDVAERRVAINRVYIAFLRRKYADAIRVFKGGNAELNNPVVFRSALYAGCFEICRSSLKPIIPVDGSNEGWLPAYGFALCSILERKPERVVEELAGPLSECSESIPKYQLWCLALLLEATVEMGGSAEAEHLVRQISGIPTPKGESVVVVNRAIGKGQSFLRADARAEESFRLALQCPVARRSAEWVMAVIAFVKHDLTRGNYSRAQRTIDESLVDINRMQVPLLKKELNRLQREVDEHASEAPDGSCLSHLVLTQCRTAEEAVKIACGAASDIVGTPVRLVSTAGRPDSGGPGEIRVSVPSIGRAYQLSFTLNRELTSPMSAKLKAICEPLGLLLSHPDTSASEGTPLGPQETSVFHGLVGSSEPMQRLISEIEIAASCDEAVLLSGETGTGKDLAAKAIYRESDRKGRPYLTVNCAALSEELLMSELFGHRRGSFTGAESDREGLFEAANGGVLFLDEIGEASPRVQSSLLRVLQNHRVRRVGETRERPIDVRVIAATNRDLLAQSGEGAFRKDLLYRLKVVEIQLPALSDHPEDIPELVSHFVDRLNQGSDRTVAGVSKEAIAYLRHRDWPGNVRELENWVRSAFVRTEEGQLLTFSGPQDGGSSETTASLKDQVSSFERGLISRELRKVNGNVSVAARRLGMSRSGLQKKMIKYQIPRRA